MSALPQPLPGHSQKAQVPAIVEWAPPPGAHVLKGRQCRASLDASSVWTQVAYWTAEHRQGDEITELPDADYPAEDRAALRRPGMATHHRSFQPTTRRHRHHTGSNSTRQPEQSPKRSPHPSNKSDSSTSTTPANASMPTTQIYAPYGNPEHPELIAQLKDHDPQFVAIKGISSSGERPDDGWEFCTITYLRKQN
jgi:hypothetical protein